MVNNLKVLEDKIKKHDYNYSFSDDHRVWSNGNRQAEELEKLAKEIGQEGIDLLESYRKKWYF
jgi:hypothetical protein